MHQEPGNNVVSMGIDLTEFYLSVVSTVLHCTEIHCNVLYIKVDFTDFHLSVVRTILVHV